jgi:4-oxalmesaconate hydratase
MIIDCHGHYTTAPALGDWRNRQIAGIQDPAAMPRVAELKISDDELRESIESNQLRLMKRARLDLTIFSPRASFMAHHIGDFQVSSTWAAICNELCYRVSQLFPDTSSAPPCCRSRPASTRPAASPSWKSASGTTASSAST